MLEHRFKLCFECSKEYETLFRCKYLDHDWVFVCMECLPALRARHDDSYTYGGTWKKHKKRK